MLRMRATRCLALAALIPPRERSPRRRASPPRARWTRALPSPARGAMLDVKGVAWGNPPMFGPAPDYQSGAGLFNDRSTISLQNKAFQRGVIHRDRECPRVVYD